MYTHTYLYTYIHTYIHTYIYIYIYIYTYIYIYIYIYKPAPIRGADPRFLSKLGSKYLKLLSTSD